MSKVHNELKKEFQLERMILFTDAVFAIAITLLIIEIKAPEIHEGMTRSMQFDQLLQLIPKFIGFLVSFVVVGIYWMAHHRLFAYLKSYSNRLIWLNLLFLFTIVLMPFSSAYYSENYGYKIPFAFYCFNIIATGIANFLLVTYLVKHRDALTERFSNPKLHKIVKLRTAVVPFAFFLCFLMSLFLPIFICSYGPMIIFPAMKLIRWKYGHERDLE